MGGDRGVLLAGRYRLLSVVGRGGMGTVWRAHDQSLGRDVAVKAVRLPPRLTGGARHALCRRLTGEARATAALQHPGVATVYDLVTDDDRPWIVLELLRARSLHEVIVTDGPLSPARAAEVGRAVLSVLLTAHAAGILHRDVKPSNILLAAGGRIVLTDFGLAVHLEQDQRIADTLIAGITGSPAYLSPEQIRGEPGTEASDLWSLGATLYACVEGRSPYLRCHALASMVAVLLGEYEPPEHAGSLRPVIDGLLRQNAADRITGIEAAALLTEAAACAPGAPVTSVPPGAPGAPATPGALGAQGVSRSGVPGGGSRRWTRCS